ncbi:hypothetical protein PV327_005317 [Microctonus hyperodae]|uniref:kynurenine--oxoglutarate transaminase n=1 Tax=Microctonus hyperodae TaxID=165561 RepID=A0AA39G1F6_MICHY|nr:hypothetical protein PV327_005317 [Microctonus hyperodae]
MLPSACLIKNISQQLFDINIRTIHRLSPAMSKFNLPERYVGNDKSVWTEYNQLAAQYKPINLGQGFPDFHIVDHVRKALLTVANSDDPLLNQYTRGFVSMYDRTITVGSAGKTFIATGWKIGWAYGPANLIRNLQVVHQNSVYTCATPLQEALAIGFEEELKKYGQPDSYFTSLAVQLLPKRDYMTKFLTEVGMSPTVPEGGIFMMANWKALEGNVQLDEEPDQYRDYKFTKWMTKNVGVQGIPPSAFYGDEHKHLAEDNVRYCFIKKDENLQQVAEVLLKWKSQQTKTKL